MTKRKFMRMNFVVFASFFFSCNCSASDFFTESPSQTPSEVKVATPQKGEVKLKSENSYTVDIVELIRGKITESITYSHKNKKILQNIMNQEDKFIAIFNACGDYFNPAYMAFGDPYKVSEKRYVVPFVCTTGIRVPSFLLFPYTEADGIQTEPLQLAVLHWEKKSKSYRSVITNKLTGFPSYNEYTKELTMESDRFACNMTTSDRCSYLTKYNLRDDKAVLKEFLSVRKTKSGQVMRQTKIYP